MEWAKCDVGCICEINLCYAYVHNRLDKKVGSNRYFKKKPHSINALKIYSAVKMYLPTS